MKRKHKGVLLLTLGILALSAALTVLFAGLSSFMQQFKSVAVLASPGTVSVEIEEPGVYTLWHDHRTAHRHGGVHHHPELPPGFTFTLVREFDQKELILDPARSRSTISTPSRDAIAVGTFLPDVPGPHTLKISSANGEHRNFSLTEGSFLSGMARLAVALVISALLGLAGILLVVVGIVLLATTPKSHPAPRPA